MAEGEDKFTKTKKEVGFVVSTQDYLMVIEGLPSSHVNDIVVTKGGGRALVTALSKDKVEAVMLDPERPKPGDYLEKAATGITLPISMNLFGRAINPLGVPLDGKASLPPTGEILDLDVVAPGIDMRSKIVRQFYTGITMVDTLLPVGRGQRELILCEPRSGKEQLFLDIIISQKGKDVICIYAGIGRSDVDVKRFAEDVTKNGADDYTVIVAATSNESAPMISITPSIASALAEYYRSKGKDVLLILDDLATHAKYSREMSLLAGRVPGRESYPADIFYQHSSIIERAGSFNEHLANGSITLLPVIETNIENFTNLIPTNVMSQTDGHILMSAALRAQGQYPAIEPDRSVTRVGRQTQTFIHKRIADKVRFLLADYHELERYARFGSELSTETQLKIRRGKVTEELLKQEPLEAVPPEVQILLMSLVFVGLFDKTDVETLRTSKKEIITSLKTDGFFTEMLKTIMKDKLEDVLEKLKSKLPELEKLLHTEVKSGNGK